MIISASRRTDIPAFYAEWFFNRLREGYVLVPNPRNPNRLGRIDLSPETVDCIVFWTKNPAPMLAKLDLLNAMGYAYYIQFTLTPYGANIEPHLPDKEELLRIFTTMSESIGARRSVWRYDPILIDEVYTVAWHMERFSAMCRRLRGFTERCVLSFVDPYKTKHRSLSEQEMDTIAAGFSGIAHENNIALFTCAEAIDLTRYGIEKASCIDQNLIESIIGCPIQAKPDPNQRTSCCCIASIDIGAYDTCPHGCTYCYATKSVKTVSRRVAAHVPTAPMLTGYPRGDEIITIRGETSQKIDQIGFF